MTWAFLAIASYFFSALSQIVDKALLHTRLPSPATYAFYTGLTSSLVIILVPFGVVLLPLPTLVLALVTGIFFVPAVYFLYTALKRCDISRIVPIVGGAIPIFLLFFGFLWLGQAITVRQLYAIGFFIFGGFVLATEFIPHQGAADSFVIHLLGAKGRHLQICGRETGKGIFSAIAAAFFFALTYFLTKQVYESPAAFIPEFFWIRMGSVLGGLAMLIVPRLRRTIFTTTPTISKSSASILMGNKIIGASGFFLLNLSFSAAANQSYVVIINAMKGLEHFFVFLFSLVLSLWYPKVFHEGYDRHSIILKLIGIALVGAGFMFLT